MFLDQKENFNFDQPTTFQINPNPLQNGLQITSKIKQEKRVAKFSPYKKQVFEAPLWVSQKEATKSTWLLNWCSQVGVRCLLMLDKSEPNLLRSSNQHFFYIIVIFIEGKSQRNRSHWSRILRQRCRKQTSLCSLPHCGNHKESLSSPAGSFW